jgi:hypothetical protein
MTCFSSLFEIAFDGGDRHRKDRGHFGLALTVVDSSEHAAS